jgi:hypothetical protein
MAAPRVDVHLLSVTGGEEPEAVVVLVATAPLLLARRIKIRSFPSGGKAGLDRERGWGHTRFWWGPAIETQLARYYRHPDQRYFGY